MKLSKVTIKNYRLIQDAAVDIDPKLTLIVGRNNTAKTSCFDLIKKAVNGERVTFDDYPLSRRGVFYRLFENYISGKIQFAELCEKIPVISLEFEVDYSLDDPDQDLGALSPFIIDVDESITTAIIRIEYKLIGDEKRVKELLQPYYSAKKRNKSDIFMAYNEHFEKLFEMSVKAINPKVKTEFQIKRKEELKALFPVYFIQAERVLGEDGIQNKDTLGSLINSFFESEEKALNPQIADEVKRLRKAITEANKDVQKLSDDILGDIVHKAIGFGYPNGEEMKLDVTTKLKIDEEIKNQTVLAYRSNSNDKLPSTHNGLGYKNLIKIEFQLYAFAEEVKALGSSCIPLLFIEEPESHMHPQMQSMFADYLESYLSKISETTIQTLLTSHSPHIANTIDFSKIRYAQKKVTGVTYKSLKEFVTENSENAEFIEKYLTLSRCDLFFADKVILVEGAAEKILVPDMIEKCKKKGDFAPEEYTLAEQYFSLIEVGGAYAYRFIPFMEFLDIPCLILTDIDSITAKDKKKSFVSVGDTTSNATIKWWYEKVKKKAKSYRVSLTDIVSMTEKDKTIKKCHLEFQTKENQLHGRSLEEAIRNVNRTYYGITSATPTEDDIDFKEKCKTDFALDLIINHNTYVIPEYIETGLKWLNEQKVQE